jgi:DNA-binding transcriptional ArsR family regulator/uncharacterized protein YndB with AHSA1/START domain
VVANDSPFEALGDPTRRAVFEALRDGPRPVGEIAAGLPVSRPAVSQHLRVLAGAGLVTSERAGTRRLYRIEPNGLAGLRAYLDSFWDGALVSFKAAAESNRAEEEQMSTTAVPAVRHAITVDAPVERAFEVFTARMTSWWPVDTHHIAEKPVETIVIEERPGGRWYERAADGSECNWGTVLAWEPPTRVVFGWHLNERWQYVADPASASEVEVRFVPDGSGTRVELEHRAFERHGAGAEEIAAAVGSEDGWNGLLERYAAAFEAK